MKTRYIVENNKLILEEPFTYRRMFGEGDEVVIDSKYYKVIRCNRNTDDSIDVFLCSSQSKISKELK